MTLTEFQNLKVGSKVNFKGGRTYTISSLHQNFEGSSLGGAMFVCKEYKNIVRQLSNFRVVCGAGCSPNDRTDYRNWRVVNPQQ